MTNAVAAVMPPPAVAPTDVFAKDAIIAWFRGEFAAANAIIDALCGHLAEIGGDGGDYDAVFAAIHRRRTNWIPILHMQRFYSIADVAGELQHVSEGRRAGGAAAVVEAPALAPIPEAVEIDSPADDVDGESGMNCVKEEESEENSLSDASDRKAGAGDGEEGHGSPRTVLQICSNHEECAARTERIKILKGFIAKEPVKGHMVNIVKGLKVYEDIFTNSELGKLSEFINELRLAGRRGELSGETFTFFNKQMKGNKREIIQLGVPLFQPPKEEATSNIETIPPVLQTVIDHLVQWRLIPESRIPNSCIINFFDEDEYSQPYFKPPHLDNPISTLVLSETTMAFGRVLSGDHLGNYKGSLTLPLKEGSLLVMRGNSADMARHVVCPSSNMRVSITFVKVRATNYQSETAMVPSLSKVMTLWQPASTLQQKASDGAIGYGNHGLVPSWGMALRGPVLMLPPPRPMMVSSTERIPGSNGTGVFLPWTVSPKKYTKHLPPRIQKRRLSSLPLQLEAEA